MSKDSDALVIVSNLGKHVDGPKLAAHGPILNGFISRMQRQRLTSNLVQPLHLLRAYFGGAQSSTPLLTKIALTVPSASSFASERFIFSRS